MIAPIDTTETHAARFAYNNADEGFFLMASVNAATASSNRPVFITFT